MPVAVGDLMKHFPADIEQIQMGVAVALGQPQKAVAVIDEVQIVMDVDPGVVGFAHNM